MAPRIHHSLPEYTPLIFNKCICAILPESTPPSKNIPPFSTTICDPPRIYPSLPEYTLFSTKVLYATLPESTPPSQNIPPLSTNILLCGALRICPTLPEYTPLFNNYMRLCQNLPLPLRIYPPPFSTSICDTPRIYPSQNISPFQQLLYYATLPESTPLSQNMFLVLRAGGRFSHIHVVLEKWPYSVTEGRFLEYRI